VTVEFVMHFTDICKICGFFFILSILPLPLLGSVAAGHRTIRFLFFLFFLFLPFTFLRLFFGYYQVLRNF
jgi:hypothetical protein